jgi:hypothetical protein
MDSQHGILEIATSMWKSQHQCGNRNINVEIATSMWKSQHGILERNINVEIATWN